MISSFAVSRRCAAVMAHFPRPFHTLLHPVTPGMSGLADRLAHYGVQSGRVTARSFRLSPDFCNIKTKYVNMADIIASSKARTAPSVAERPGGGPAPEEPI